MAIAPQHWLSLARVALGAIIWRSLSIGERSSWVFPLVLIACLLDFADGRVARAYGSDGPIGRTIDNGCDFVFLALCFHAFARMELWSDPTTSVAVKLWRGGNGLPLLALALSFGSYAWRAAVCAARGLPLTPSPVGRAAGVLNYALALVGGVAVSPHWHRQRTLLEVSMAFVVAANLAAFLQNGILLARQLRRRAS